jgi:hypothetical protein
MAIAKPVQHKDPEVDGFRLRSGVDGYMRTIEIGITRANDGMYIPLCTVTNGVGHCCAASMIGNIRPYDNFWSNIARVDSFIKVFHDKWKAQEEMYDKKYERLSCFIISGFYVLLSDETRTFDAGIRDNPQFTKVHSFRNRRNGYDHTTGNEISLYFINF